MSMIDRRTQTLILTLISSYAVVSCFCFLVLSIPWLKSFIEANWRYVWLLGPPAALLYRLETAYFTFYIISSFVLFVPVFFAIRVRSLTAKVWAVLFFVLLWAIAGFLIMGSTV